MSATNKAFAEAILQSPKAIKGARTIRLVLERFERSGAISNAARPEAHHEWANHRDYHKYTPPKHTIMCCGWTDWHDHRDS